MEHYPEQWTDANYNKRLTCICGNDLPCPNRHPITSELAEKRAQDLLLVASQLGKIMGVVDSMGRENWQAIKEEPEAYEHIVLQGADMQYHLRTLAMRLDRAATGKHHLVSD